MKRDLEAVVGAFIDAFNSENVEATVAVLSPAVEIHGRRGIVRGRERAREWATRNPSGELSQRLELDGVLGGPEPQVALVRRQWVWANSGEVADEEPLAVLVALDDDGLISRWQPFDDRAEAVAAAGLRGARIADGFGVGEE